MAEDQTAQIRDKDAAISKRCKNMAQASKKALSWFEDNQKLVGYRRANLDRMFKKHALEATKLSRAAERPMSVGVFGASQAGKSFLTGSFIAPQDNPVKVVFGDAENPTRMSFLDEVNPAGGNETTGLVTRFSIRRQDPPSPDYPVGLRFLSECDIAKILANTYVLDLRARPDQELKQERLSELIQAAEAQRKTELSPGMAIDQVLDLEQYIQEELEDHPLNKDETLREEYWLALERLAPHLDGPARMSILAPLWGEIREFSDLYLELRQALDQVDHPEFVFTPLDAIKDRTHGVLHVQTIYHLDPEDAEGNFAQDGRDRITVMSDQGKTASLRKAVVTALTAELQVTLEDKPWPFLEHTDLLDFPGARGRESKTASEFLRGEEFRPHNRAYCFLRGKIAVLFDKYSADLDLNTMLLCSDDGNQEVRKLAELIQRWVARTHGATPKDRAGAKTALLLCLTKADRLLDQKTGATLEETIQTRISKDVVFYQSWTKEWTTDKPFDNIVFARNPKFERKDLFSYEELPPDAPEGSVSAESGLLDGARPLIERFKEAFVEVDVVKRHVSDPRAKLDAIFELNDGGITYIANTLAPTCDPDLKYQQIAPRAQALAERMRASLFDFYEAGDVQQRIAERRAETQKVVKRLSAKPALIGQFIASLQTDEETMGAVYLEVARGEVEGPRDDEIETAGEGDQTDSGFDFGSGIGIELDGFDDDDGSADAGEQNDKPPAARKGLAAVFGEAAVRRWLLRIQDASESKEYAETFGLGPAEFAIVVQELETAARRYRLAEAIADRVTPIIQYHQRPDEHMHRVAIVSCLEINDLVNRLGRDRSDAQNKGKTLFNPPEGSIKDGLPELPSDTKALKKFRSAPMRDWLEGLMLLTEESAASTEGGIIDVEQNERMGKILSLVTLDSD